MLDLGTSSATALYCTFFLDGQRFAVPVLQVREVHAVSAITPIPGAPTAIRGYVNLRGHLHVAVDPRPWLIGQGGTSTDSHYLIVFKPSVGEACAILVDQIADIVAIHRDQLNVPHAETGQRQESHDRFERLITGYAKLPDTLLTLVDPIELFRLVWLDT